MALPFPVEKVDAIELEEGGCFIERWKEFYGDIVISVEVKKGDWGGMRRRQTERAVVEKIGHKKRLFKAERTLINGEVLISATSTPGVVAETARDMAFVWAMGHSMVAQAAFLERQEASRRAEERRLSDQIEAVSKIGIVQYLADNDVGAMSTIEIADVAQISGHRLAAWLGWQKFARYNSRTGWSATNPGHQVGSKGRHVIWNALGVNLIREKLCEFRLLGMTEGALIQLFQKRHPDHEVWKVVEKVCRDR